MLVDGRPQLNRPLRSLALCLVAVAVMVFIAALYWDVHPTAILLEYHHALQQRAQVAFWHTALLYVFGYAVVVALALPGGAVMSLAGGYLFGIAFGVVFAISGATLGALATLVLIHSALGNLLRARLGGRLEWIRSGFQRDPVQYLLLLRLIPVFPFFVVNIAVALLGARTAPFLWTTVVGLLPSTVAFAVIGDGLGAQLQRGALPGPSLLLEPTVILPSTILASLLLLRALWRHRLRTAAKFEDD